MNIQLAVGVVVANVLGKVPLNTRQLLVTLLGKAKLATDHRLERGVKVCYPLSASRPYCLGIRTDTQLNHLGKLSDELVVEHLVNLASLVMLCLRLNTSA